MCPDAQLESPHFYSQQGKGEERGLRAYAKKKRNCWDLSSASNYYQKKCLQIVPKKKIQVNYTYIQPPCTISSGRNGQHPWLYDSAIYKRHAIASTLYLIANSHSIKKTIKFYSPVWTLRSLLSKRERKSRL